jgi:ribulose 1,5-bisphosphate carboxylase large subunit-like protein
VNPFVQGLDGLLALRQAGLGVPLFAHGAGSGPLARNPSFGPTGAVLARVTRRCGADYVIAGAFGGKLFETPDEVRANLEATRGPCGSSRSAVAALGGGLGPADVATQQALAGGTGLLVLLGSQAYGWPGSLEAAVRAAVDQL